MKRFKPAGQAERFLSDDDGINNLFHLRPLSSARHSAVTHPDPGFRFGPRSPASTLRHSCKYATLVALR